MQNLVVVSHTVRAHVGGPNIWGKLIGVILGGTRSTRTSHFLKHIVFLYMTLVCGSSTVQ